MHILYIYIYIIYKKEKEGRNSLFLSLSLSLFSLVTCHLFFFLFFKILISRIIKDKNYKEEYENDQHFLVKEKEKERKKINQIINSSV